MPQNDVLTFIEYLSLGLVIFIGFLFFLALFVIRPMELGQFNFQKRVQLSFSAMQGEENFFTKAGYKKLKLYRKIWVLFFILILLRLGLSFV